jgi:hypothetical protein
MLVRPPMSTIAEPKTYTPYDLLRIPDGDRYGRGYWKLPYAANVLVRFTPKRPFIPPVPPG